MKRIRKGKAGRLAFLMVFTALLLQITGGLAFAVETLPGQEVQVSTGPGNYFGPSIYDNKVVWMGKDTVALNIYSDVFLKDGNTQSKINTEGVSNQFVPAIYGNIIVWDDGKSIFMYDASQIGAKPERISNPADGIQTDPAIFGDKVVWQVEKNKDLDICIYDIKTTVFQHIYKGGNQILPVIYGDTVVWQDNRNGNWDIYKDNISFNNEIRVTTDGANHYYPAIYGKYIVWEEWPITTTSPTPSGAASDIYYNLNDTETPITLDVYKQYDPAIYGDKVIWTDNRDGGKWDIYMYDITKAKEYKVTEYSGDDYFPAIYSDSNSDKIVWTSKREYGLEDIYMKVINKGSTDTHSGGGGGGSAVIPEVNPFIDVPNDYWAVNEILDLYNVGIVKGFPDKTYRPQKPVTRAEFAVMMAKTLKLDLPSGQMAGKFTDVPGSHWAFGEIEALNNAGIMIGYGKGIFKPDAVIKREELVQVIIKALHYKNGPGSGADRKVLDIFTDKDRIPEWARDAVAEAVSLDLVRGIAKDKFGAGTNATRDQVAVLVSKLLKQINK